MADKPRCNYPTDWNNPAEVCGKTEAQHGAGLGHEFGTGYTLASSTVHGLDDEDGEATCYVSVSLVLEDGITRSMMWAAGEGTTETDLLNAALSHLSDFVDLARLKVEAPR